MSAVQDIATFDIRFPTSTMLDGSDAMNPDPDYSAAYLRLDTDAGDQGHGFVFTIGRGNDVQLAAVRAVAEQLRGEHVEPLLDDMGSTWRRLVHDSQLRWLGP
jgi:L-fuconate dehydratase